VVRILIGHLDTELPPYDRTRFDVRCVRHVGAENRPPATIAEMLEQCPSGWIPDVYYHAALVHFPIPDDIETFAGLTATNIQDWHRGGRTVWAGSAFFDLIATERNACALLNEMGYANARFARFWGVDPALHRVLLDVERDIDVLFIGSINPDIWAERNRWLDRLAQLSDRYRVVIASGHYGEQYVRLTNRAKIVFNRSVNGCANQRAYDGPACGALVFNETENAEVRESFVEGVHCVYYSEADFEEKLAYYLAHDAERERIAEAGRLHTLARHTAEAHQNALFALLEESLPLRGYRPAASLPAHDRAYRKAVQIYAGALPAVTNVAMQMLTAAEQEGLEPYLAHEGRAALEGWSARYLSSTDRIKLLNVAIQDARQAVRAEPRHAPSQMALAFLLLERAEATGGAHPTGRNDIAEAVVALTAAADRCEAALETETDGAIGDIDGFCYPRWNDSFDAKIERAALLRSVDEAEWAQEMRKTLAWRCRCLLRDLAAANAQHEETGKQAVAAVNALPTDAQSLLALARYAALIGDLEHAVTYYRLGLSRSPLSYEAWPEYAAVLKAYGQPDEAQMFVATRLRVTAAIPALAAIRPALLESTQ
jgi:hypothetical protein